MAAGAGMKRSRNEMSGSSASGRDEFRYISVQPGVKAAIQRLVLQLLFDGADYNASRYTGSRPELPGPLPATLSRRTLGTVQQSPYWVCEKSDGERAMLLMLNTTLSGVPPGAYLLDRSFEVSTFNRAEEYHTMCAPTGPTLIDGELLLRDHDEGTGTGKAVYMMFDMIAANGAPVGKQNFLKRMEAIANSARLPFQRADDLAKSTLPLFLMGKHFVPKSNVKSIFDCIVEAHHAADGGLSDGVAQVESELGADGVAAARHRTYKNGKRINGTDGIIFTPEEGSYVDMFSPEARFPLLKWKFSDENTVDFKIMTQELLDASDTPAYTDAKTGRRFYLLPLYVYPGSTMRLRMAEVPDVKIARCAVTAAACDAYAALFRKWSKPDVIVECAFTPSVSAWTIRRIRDKKTKANALNTAWQTLEIVAENITAAQLCDSLAPAPTTSAAAMATAGVRG